MSLLTPREKDVLRLLAEDSSISVPELAKRFGVSAVTIRTDLNSLSRKGYVVLRKGSAFPAFHQSILRRQETLMDEKNRIAKAAADLIQDGDNVMILAGTTNALIAKYCLGKRDVHIVTNSTLLLPYVRVNPAIHLTLVGGEFRPSIEGTVGPLTATELRQFHVRIAFLGTDGFTLDKGLTAHLVEDAEVAKVMAGQAEQVVLVTDSTKYGKAGFAHMLPLHKMSMLITDEALSPQAIAELAEHKIAVKLV
jgi:DeoR family galactitol utilization operon repressor